MPTDAELRTLFHDARFRDDVMPKPSIDVGAVIRRSKRRRLPQQLGAGGVLTLAVAGIGVASVSGLRSFMPSTTGGTFTAAESSPGDALGDQLFGDSRAELASGLNRCGERVAQTAPSTSGLAVTTSFPATASVADESVPGIVTLTNTGSRAIVGTSSAVPVVTVASLGVTVWHTTPSEAVRQIAIAPGETVDYEAAFTPVLCTTESELTSGSLPSLEPGDYQVSAAIDFATSDGVIEVISGSASTVPLR